MDKVYYLITLSYCISLIKGMVLSVGDSHLDVLTIIRKTTRLA